MEFNIDNLDYLGLKFKILISMASIKAGNISKGIFIMFKNAPHYVTKTEFMNPGKGAAIMRVRLRHVRTGSVADFTYKTSEQVEQAEVDKKEMQYLYRDSDDLVFMDPRSYDQVNVPVSLFDGKEGYLVPETTCSILFYDDAVIGVSLPPHVTLSVIQSPDAVAGNRVNAPKKEVTLETGIRVQAPLFIKVGEKVVLDTNTGEYLSRASLVFFCVSQPPWGIMWLLWYSQMIYSHAGSKKSFLLKQV